MRKLFLFVLIVLALSLPRASFAAAPKDAPDSVARMAGEVIAHFPRAEGRVTYADERKVRLDIGSKSGLKPGMEIFLFRPGTPIRHPVTKVILGNREEPLGRAVLTDVKEGESEGEIKELKVTQVIPGDVGRLSTERTKLLVAVYGKDYNEMALSRLMDSLKGSGRFDVTGPVELPKEPDLDAAAAKGLIDGNGAHDLVTLKTAPTKKVNQTKVELALFSAEGTAVERQGGVVDMTSEVYGETEMNYPLVRGEHRDFYHMENLPFRAKHMAAGNIMGDGRTTLAVSDGYRLIVYRFEEGALKELWREEDTQAGEQLDVECADLNGNGTDEIYVTTFSQGLPSSYVIEYDGKSFKKIWGPELVFLRVLDVPGAGRKLITTTVGKNSPYSGIIREYKWEGAALVKGDRLALPGKIKDIYGFVFVDLTPEGRKDIKKKGPFDGLAAVWVDDSDYLQVLDSKGKRLWKSPDHYGGYDNFFEVDIKETAGPNVDNRGHIKGRLTVREGAEGEKQIILTKNIPMTYGMRRFRGYSGAEIYSLVWNGTEMETRWVIRNIDGYLSDIAVGDVSNNGREEIAIITDPTIKFVKKSKNLPMGSVASIKNVVADKAALLFYKVPQR